MASKTKIHLHQGDLPKGLKLGRSVAIDTEAMGLNNHRDRLCLVQLSPGNGEAHLVQIAPGKISAPNLRALLTDAKVAKLFHFGRFDIAILQHSLKIDITNVYCTKIASRLCRTYTDKHNLATLCRELLGVELNKQQQSSDWGQARLTREQMAYAADDVLYLHRLREKLDEILAREGRTALAQACFDFLPARARLDTEGWPEIDIFAH
ncbi:MAG: ribonuclease D [Micavibrio aeruginosavorus]|uniref:Ribonuclease D n=1 Tax=Micavibrio aeruginosavorus TaxID=349221 RepID=A0A7T5UGT1_9BACT|nr:MAG: ribonuclease D [Micavibrio aeruginosavorus]